MVLEPKIASFNFEKEFSIEIPIWVKFPKLSLNYKSSNCLSMISSQAGAFIHVDECTTKKTRILYARMLIEVNVTRALLDEIAVMELNGKVLFTQTVEYY
ncbi:hypothetical protein H5410_050124 [Solanum commersonii]|uniref:DUF4283 domain-containing protein n=1 Tax=Solanum commersonii TaxID=4109 RepID=A0A9J5WUK6_SOLCO|nr:hypothetical protein H5410_050124 [Solanum commersonii]